MAKFKISFLLLFSLPAATQTVVPKQSMDHAVRASMAGFSAAVSDMPLMVLNPMDGSLAQ